MVSAVAPINSDGATQSLNWRSLSEPHEAREANVETQNSPSPLVVVLGALSAACIVLTVASAIQNNSDAPAFFGALALVLAFASARMSHGGNQSRHVVPMAVLIAAFWTTGLWVLWRTWRVVGGVYDHVFPHAAHDRFWRATFQLISIPLLALILQILLIMLLTWLNDISNRRRFRASEARASDVSNDPSAT